MEESLEASVCFRKDTLMFAGLKKEEQHLLSSFSAEHSWYIPVIDAEEIIRVSIIYTLRRNK